MREARAEMGGGHAPPPRGCSETGTYPPYSRAHCCAPLHAEAWRAWVRPPYSMTLIVLGLAACAALWTIGPAEPATLWPAALLRGYVAAWLCYLLAAIVVTRARALPRWVLAWIVVAAVVLRVVSLVHAPPMSTDSYRYLWDGRVTNAGINPYRHPPDAPELRHLRDANWRMSFKEIPTLYPPGAEILFAGLARIRATDRAAFAWAFLGCDLGTILLLIALLRRTGRAPERVIWYAWSPLAAVETAAGCHVDTVALFFLVLALWLIARRGTPTNGSALSYAAAVLCKGPAVFALPCLAVRGGGRFLAVFLAAGALLTAPFLGAGTRMFTGLGYYMKYWETNSSVFYLLHSLVELITGVRTREGFTPVVVEHFAIVRGVTTVALIAFIVWLIRRRRPGLEWLLGSVFAVLAANLLLGAPTLPWYVIWTVPLLCWWPIPGWVVFTLTVFGQYYARWLNSAWYPLPLLLGYLPVYALLISDWVRWRLRASSAAVETPSPG